MTTFDRWLIGLANLLVGGTGLVYAWMRYLLQPADEFAIVNHPWQPGVQHLHILVAPLLVIAFGQLWHQHAWLAWRAGAPRGRRTGLTMLATGLPMIFSGYLIQISTEEVWRNVWVVVHVAVSLLWLTGYASHVIRHRLRGDRARDGLL